MTSEGQKPARSLNIRDIAKLAGVSYQTVSRVLNDSPSIRPETRQRVLDVIEQTGFRPNQAARALVTSKTGTIGVLVASQDASYGIQTMTYAVEAAAREAGYRVSITSCASDDASVHEALDRLVQQAVEAVVVVAPQVRVFRAIFAASLKVPFVTLDSTRRDIGHSISVDQFAGARLATSHLIGLGHERIIHLAGPQDWIEAEARMQGYLFELTERDLPVTPPILGDWTADFGYRAGVELLWRRDFTAVFAASDLMALGVLHAFREAGVDVPGEVSVVGFDDIPESAHFWPPLTTIRQNFAETGRRAVGLLVAELREERVPQPTPIQPELVVRSTTATAPSGGV